MDNKTLMFILKMKDEATAAFNKAKSTIETGSKSMVENFKKNWLAISAAGIAAFVAVQKAWKYAELGAKAMEVEHSFVAAMSRIGVNAEATFQGVNKAAAGILDDSDVKQMITRATALGVPVEKLGDLMLVARAKAREMGIGLDAAFSALSEGIGRVRPMTLAQVGIVIKSKEVMDELKKSTGETGEATGTFAQRQMLLNEVIKEGGKSVASYNLNVLTHLEKMQQLKARQQAMQEDFGALIIRLGYGVSAAAKSIYLVFEVAMTGIVGLATLGEKAINFVFGTKSQTMQNAFNAGMKEIGKSAKDITTDLDDMVRSYKAVQDGSIKAASGIETVGAAAKFASGSLLDLQERSKNITEAMSKLNINTKSGFDAWGTYAAQLKEVSDEMKHIIRLQSFMVDGMNIPLQMKLTKKDEEKLDKEVGVIVKRVNNGFKDMSVIDAEAFNRNMDSVKQGLSMLHQFGQQKSDARIWSLEAEKEAAMNAINAELAVFSGSEAEKEALLARRTATEQEFNRRIADEKRSAFASQKTASILEATINTAVAMTKTIGQLGIFGIPMMAVVGALGAAQVALIASQPTPKFHKGGIGYFDAPEDEETLVKIRGKETIRVTTPQQEKNKNSSGIHFYINSITSKEAFKKVVQEGMREMGVTDVRDYFVNNRNGVVVS
jgi:hypothetical protein